MKVSTVILDVDGTLIDTNYLHIEAWAQALRAAGLDVPRSVIHKQIGKGADHLLPVFLDDEAKRKQAEGVHAEVFAKLKKQATPLPGAKELLKALDERGLQLWIGSSAKPEEVAEHLQMLDATKRIDGTVCQTDVARSKPAPDVFLRVLEKSEARPEETVVLGDTPWDVEAARAAGVRAVMVLTGGGWSRQELQSKGAFGVYQDCLELVRVGFPEGL